VLWIEDSRGELEPATLEAIDRNITDEYTLEDGVWYEGIIDSVTRSYAKVRFDEDGVTKQLNLFKEFEGSKPSVDDPDPSTFFTQVCPEHYPSMPSRDRGHKALYQLYSLISFFRND
jgi:hypothetical protein